MQANKNLQRTRHRVLVAIPAANQKSRASLLLSRLVATTSFVAYEDDLRSVKQHLDKLEAQLQQAQKRLETIRKKRQQKEKRSKPR